jgi:hypothetical protein
MGQRKLREMTKVEAAVLLRGVANPSREEDTDKQRIDRAAARLGWTRARTTAIWQGKARRIDVWEIDQLRNWRPDV